MRTGLIRVLATGTFDLLHPGHLLYLEQSRALGDELVVIVARDANVKHKPKPIIPQDQRLLMVSALKMVDRALLGSETDMFQPIEEFKPDVITLGYDQHFDAVLLKEELATRGIDAQVVRLGGARPLSPLQLPHDSRKGAGGTLPIERSARPEGLNRLIQPRTQSRASKRQLLIPTVPLWRLYGPKSRSRRHL